MLDPDEEGEIKDNEKDDNDNEDSKPAATSDEFVLLEMEDVEDDTNNDDVNKNESEEILEFEHENEFIHLYTNEDNNSNYDNKIENGNEIEIEGVTESYSKTTDEVNEDVATFAGPIEVECIRKHVRKELECAIKTITNDTNANMDEYLMSIDPIGKYLMFSPHLHRCTLTPAILDAILESGSLGNIKCIHKDNIRAVSGNRKKHNWLATGHVP